VTVRIPVTAQATSSQPALPTCRAMSAETMKIPDPIIDPTTTIVESNRPRPRLNSRSVTGWTAGCAFLVGSSIGHPDVAVPIHMKAVRKHEQPRANGRQELA